MSLALEVVRISRVEAIRARHPHLLEALFTELEWSWCTGRRKADQHLAARIAAKRAAMRLIGRRAYASLEVRRDDRGAPHLHGFAGPWLLSLTHDGDLAVALLHRGATCPSS